MKEPLIRVLLVTDSPVRRELALPILSLAGDMEVATAADGAEGLELAWTWRPDVILVDAVLPVLSGVELLRRYRGEGGRAKVLVATKSCRPTVRSAAFSAGADFVLLEPSQWSEILHHIRFLAGGFSRRCRALLREMNAPEHWDGFDQAAVCAGALGEGRCHLLKEAYVEAAVLTRTEVDCVEVNIRRLIRALHARSAPAYRALPGLKLGDRPPCNRDFLLSLAQAARFPL